MLSTLENLFNLARERKKSPVDGSYTNKLLSDKSLSKEKVLEEINELVEAVENNSNKKTLKQAWRFFLLNYLFVTQKGFEPPTVRAEI